MRRRGFLILIILLSLVNTPLTAQTTSAPAKPSNPAPAPPEAIDRLIKNLSSPRWPQREAAGNALMDMGTAAYRALRSEFLETTSYDVRRRIRQIAREIYLAEHLGPPRAFLGISHNRGGIGTNLEDSRVPPWASGLLITDVFYGTGADRAGLLRGDLIMALNGRTGTKEYQAIEFTQWIGAQKPGAVCLLNLVRGGEGVYLDGTVITGFTPAAFAKAKVRVVRHEDDPRVPYESAGILLENVDEVDWKMKTGDAGHIEAGDLLLALNDIAIPLEGTLEHYETWRQGRLPLKEPEPQPAQARRNVAPQARPSAHLLRGGKGFDMEVTLGRRPANLDTPARQTHGGEPTEREQVLASFATWWQKTFDPQGLLADTADEDPRWELEPRWGGR